MKRILLYLVSLFVVGQTFAQYESAGMPLQFTVEKQNLKRSVSSFFIDIDADTTKVILESSRREFISGITCPIDISMNEGNTFIQDNMKVWRVGLRSENAKGISLYFDRFLLPEGAKLFVYNPTQTIVFGAFTSENNNDENKLLIRPLASDSVVVEYQEPLNASFEADLHLSLATHELRGVNKFMASNKCSPIASLEDKTETLRQSVCLLFMVGSTTSSWGSGALINNTQHKPYIFTAGHNLTSADIATRTIYYFNYDVPVQKESYQGSRQFTISGSKLISRDSNVDFALAELNKMPPADYRPYMAGWTRNTPKSPYMSIQHPYGDIKKVSYASDIFISSFNNNGYKTYWWIKRWNEGVTEAGSSGSPLFDADGYIIGELTGGSSFCDTPVNDYYCQLSAAWNYYTDKTKQIACYIDPDGTDIMSMEGYDPYSDLGVRRISNIKKGDKIANYTINDTPLVGHTYGGYTKFAEKFELDAPVSVYGVYIMPYNGVYNTSNPITLEIYSGEDKPQTLLSSIVVHPTEAYCNKSGTYFEKDIESLDNQEIYVPLEKPLTVNTNLFVALGVSYENIKKADWFAMPCVVGGSKCTAYFYDNEWKSFNENPYASNNVSIWIEPIVGFANISTIDEAQKTQSNFAVYPNPTNGEVFVTPTFEGAYRLFDMTGKMLDAGVYDNQINLSEKGFYILELLSNEGLKETHKIICR